MSDRWGYFVITLDQLIRKKGFDRDRLAHVANIQKNQLKLYIDNEVKRPDLNVLARICAVLGCDVGEVIRYVPPQSPIDGKTTEDGEIRRVYTTGMMAREANVHPNTVRFYERIGLISPAKRAANGYRQFSYRHLIQLRICRIIFSEPYTNTLRSSAFTVVDALRQWDLGKARENAEAHQRLVEKEYAAALETAALLKLWTEKNKLPATGRVYRHKEAASLLGVTIEVLRNWERNGLISVLRTGTNKARVYGDEDIARLHVIYMLRQNNYSIAAIQRSLSIFDSGNSAGAVLALNQPAMDDEIEYISVGDHWLEVLNEISLSAEKIKQTIIKIRE